MKSTRFTSLFDQLISLSNEAVDREKARHILTDALYRLQDERERQATRTAKDEDDDLITAKQVREITKVGHTYLNDLKKIGALTGQRMGKGDVFRESEVRAWISNMRNDSFRIDINKRIKQRRQEEERRKEAA